MAQLSCSAYVNIKYGIDVDPGQREKSVLTLEFNVAMIVVRKHREKLKCSSSSESTLAGSDSPLLPQALFHIHTIT